MRRRSESSSPPSRPLPQVGRDNERSRERWLEQTLRALPAGQRILDAGAGTQQYKRCCGHLRYVAQDFGQYNGRGDAAGLQTGTFDYGTLDLVSDITAIPEPDGAFDVVMCVEVLEHIPRPELAIRELARLLRPGGLLIVTAPFCSLTHMAPYHFFSGFSRYWYERTLAEHGFTILEMQPNGNFFEYLAQELWRLESIAERYTQLRLDADQQAAVMAVQELLAGLSCADAGSSELLCFGYHVQARKA